MPWAWYCPYPPSMPRKRRRNGRRRRGRTNRRQGQRRNTDQVSRNLGVQSYSGSKFSGRGGFPPSLRLRTRWSAAGSLVAGTGATTFSIYGNAVYQPCAGFNTNSAYDFVKLSSIYKLYRVYASRIVVKATLASTSTTPTATAIGGDMIIFWNYQATTGGLGDALQQPGAKWVRLGQNQKTINSGVTTKFVLQFDPSVDENQAAGALTPGRPSTPWFWNLVVACDAAYTGITVLLDVVVHYDVEFFELVANAAQFTSSVFRPEVKGNQEVKQQMNALDDECFDSNGKVTKFGLASPTRGSLANSRQYKSMLDVLRSCAKGENKEVVERLTKEYEKIRREEQFHEWVIDCSDEKISTAL